MAVCMLAFVHILSNAAVEFDIKKSLEREMYSNLKELKKISVSETGELSYEGDLIQTEGDIFILILDSSGKALYGNYPKGCPQDIPPGTQKLHQVSAGGEVFYIRDIRRYSQDGSRLCMRGIVCRSDTYSRYQTMEYLSYVSILAVFGIAILGGVILSRRISGSLKSMCQSAEKIGRDMNMSSRIAYDGKFYELAVLAQANNRMLDRLEDTFRQQEQFTSDVAHELRTPIAVMTAQCQYAHDRSVSMDDYKEAFEIIERQSAKISAIIARLLELSRLDYDRRQIQMEDVDLPEIVQSICEDLQQKSGDTLQFALNLSEVHAVGDISLAAIAIQNLLTNAVRYSGPGSRIEVETGTSDGMAYVKVRDYGIGIQEEDMPHIFKRFYKADKSRNSDGFGLGLPLTMKIAQKHGGNVLAESRAGEGSTFTLLLPCKNNLYT